MRKCWTNIIILLAFYANRCLRRLEFLHNLDYWEIMSEFLLYPISHPLSQPFFPLAVTMTTNCAGVTWQHIATAIPVSYFFSQSTFTLIFSHIFSYKLFKGYVLPFVWYFIHIHIRSLVVFLLLISN